MYIFKPQGEHKAVQQSSSFKVWLNSDHGNKHCNIMSNKAPSFPMETQYVDFFCFATWTYM